MRMSEGTWSLAETPPTWLTVVTVPSVSEPVIASSNTKSNWVNDLSIVKVA
jgi:hypothetical protein